MIIRFGAFKEIIKKSASLNKEALEKKKKFKSPIIVLGVLRKCLQNFNK